MFLNDFDSKKDILDKLLLYKGRFLEIYNFNKSKKGIEALHAKVISVDSKKSLITSANLSFNGLQKNIEVGSMQLFIELGILMQIQKLRCIKIR